MLLCPIFLVVKDLQELLDTANAVQLPTRAKVLECSLQHSAGDGVNTWLLW
ncbi:hypothetical protein [Deinococcus cellulosilyticus]|uniref:Uncharacterized protein n=1 Tax=Deinococcus cellulosilyticus (strain DSM 18568 / NBRC 106333 / KACC 11606 / 5516J-15) TaxID=1223518 RepID=A0A511N7K6_DEIC1|nr:hypothetical protein [Deinococcus cellulosilyticus]GEM48401.1 hypothetical protein DC3_40360 [Deinococcus cellulosilyticus NBRC 106333 = KACC 11606]